MKAEEGVLWSEGKVVCVAGVEGGEGSVNV